MEPTPAGEEGASQSPKNLLKTRHRRVPAQAAVQPKAETEVLIVNDLDLEHLMTSVHVRKMQSAINDQCLLAAATNFFCSLDVYLENLRKMPDPKMGLVSPVSEKIDLSPCLLSARELQEMATEYAFTYPMREQQDVAKRQMAAGFANLTESFLFVSCAENAHAPMNKDKAMVMGGMVVDTKNSLRELLTQYSMIALPAMQRIDPKS